MGKDLAVLIYYKGSGFGSSEIAFSDLEELKSELQEHYIANATDTVLPQAGGILDTVVEIFSNEAFRRLTNIVFDGLVFDLIINRKNSILLKPLIAAFQKIEAKTDCWDYTRVRFNFDDVLIEIFGAGKIFTSVVGKVFPELLKHFKLLEHKEYGFPTRISMPIQKTDWGENGSEKWISPAGDGQEYFAEECLTFWGLEYGSKYNRMIYDYKNKTVLDIDWN
nr:hypothetical protein [uncultured Draconibacterium sp.]